MMDEYEREDMRRDVEIDAQFRKYRVAVPVVVTYVTHERSREEAECEAYEAVRDALRAAHLDYDFDEEFDTEEVDD